MEKCCLLTSGNESYERAMKNVKELTGILVSHSTQQRLVQRYDFPVVELADTIEEMSLDGGKIRLRTAKGKKSEWKDYKSVTLQGKAVVAYFQDNQALVERVQQQPLAEIVSCLGDGHDGIWNLFAQIAPREQRFEILDWYHLVEHLHGVGGSMLRLKNAEQFLWDGDVASAISLFEGCKFKRAVNFVSYLRNHCLRIPEYSYFHHLGLTIGSGSVESSIKQIARRIKISGAQWNQTNVPQVLQHRCAYLNGFLDSSAYNYSLPT